MLSHLISRKTILLLTLAVGVTVVAVLGAWASTVVGMTVSGPTNVPGKITAHHAPWADALEILFILVVMTTLPGVITYVLVSHDLPRWGTALTTAGCVITMGVGSWLGFVFASFAFLVTAACYLLLRSRLRAGPALAVSAVILAGGLVWSVMTMSAALDGMG